MNIVNLLGACTKGDRLFIIMEYAPHGNLLMFLRNKREIYEPTWITTTNNPENELTIKNLVVFAYQIARGMEFLTSKQVWIHLVLNRFFSLIVAFGAFVLCQGFFIKKF